MGGEKGGFNQVVNMVAVRDVCSTERGGIV